jgi:hypothetical protein
MYWETEGRPGPGVKAGRNRSGSVGPDSAFLWCRGRVLAYVTETHDSGYGGRPKLYHVSVPHGADNGDFEEVLFDPNRAFLTLRGCQRYVERRLLEMFKGLADLIHFGGNVKALSDRWDWKQKAEDRRDD